MARYMRKSSCSLCTLRASMERSTVTRAPETSREITRVSPGTTLTCAGPPVGSRSVSSTTSSSVSPLCTSSVRVAGEREMPSLAA